MSKARTFTKLTMASGATAVLGLAVRQAFVDPPETVDPFRTAKAAGVMVAVTWLLALL